MNTITKALNVKATKIEPKENCVNEIDDEYTSFTNHLEDVSPYNSTDTLINNDDSRYNQSFSSLDDFVGGPINDELSIDFGRESKQNECCEDFNRSITATPADSSCGFHNTFSVLEKHLNKNKNFKLSQQQIEYLLLKNRETAVQNDFYIDIPLRDNQCFRIVKQLIDNNSTNETSNRLNDDNEPSSLFEIEFEAMEWLRSTSNQTVLSNNTNESLSGDNLNSTHDELDEAKASLVEEFYQQDDNCCRNGENNDEYIYHVAKSRDGNHYIRVLRNLRLDQGKNSIFFYQTKRKIRRNKKRM